MIISVPTFGPQTYKGRHFKGAKIIRGEVKTKSWGAGGGHFRVKSGVNFFLKGRREKKREKTSRQLEGRRKTQLGKKK